MSLTRRSSLQQPLQMVNNSGATTSNKKTKTAASPFVICTSGLSAEDNKLARKTAEQLEGECLQNLNDKCMYLVANKVGSKKYELATNEYGIPVVSMEFIKACYAESKLVDFRDYQLGSFAGLIICPTGFEEKQRTALKKLVESNGGVYESSFKPDRTTHLVVGPTGQDTPKYQAAVEHEIPLVNMQWIEACAEDGAWKPEAGYQPKIPASTKNDSSKQTTSSTSLRRSSTSTSTLLTSDVKLSVPTDDEFEVEKTLWSQLEKRSGAYKCLRKCFILIECRHDSERWKTLRNLARFCGAMVLGEYAPSVTHVVVASSTTASTDQYISIVKDYLRKDPGLYCVKPKFLVECAKDDEHVNEGLFKWRARMSQPLKQKLICVSQYKGEERAEVERLCKELGGRYTERLTKENPKVDILICMGDTSEKSIRAQEWGIQIFDLDWLRQQRA